MYKRQDLTDRIPHMLGVRTEDWKLVRYPDIDDIDELYDLKADPHEMKNLALDPEHAVKHKQLGGELDRLMKATAYGSKPIPGTDKFRGKRPSAQKKK